VTFASNEDGDAFAIVRYKGGRMFLGAYHFDGEPGVLLAAYRRMMQGFPPESSDLHLCIERSDGITVYDACPSKEIFAGFSTGPEFRAAVKAAGLPAPRVEQLGAVRTARLRSEVEL
jgi:hypothetical protein